jgi:hypothetical protein
MRNGMTIAIALGAVPITLIVSNVSMGRPTFHVTSGRVIVHHSLIEFLISVWSE